MSQPTQPTETKPTETRATDQAKSKTETKTTNGTKKRGRPAGTNAKVWDYTGLTADFLAAPAAVTDQLASMAAPVRARDERQIAMDAIVSAVYSEWDSKGRPAKWAQMPKRSYAVSPEVADTVRMMVRRAASWLGYSAKFGQTVRDQNGNEIVVFAIRAQRTRAAKTETDTFTLEDLRAFVSEFYGPDEAEAADEFMAALVGESDEEGDES